MISEATLPVRTRLHQLSEPPKDFIGRVLELEAHAHVLEQGHAHLTGWWGTSGAGKTALALKLAKQLTPRYPDAQIYIDLKGHTLQPLSAVEVLAHVIRAYHPIANLPDNRNELLEVYRSLLNGKRVMIVLDNAASTIQVEPLIPPGTCAMIVASRRPLNLATLPQTHLSALTSDDARTLLLKYVPHVDTHVDAIVERCGRLPLALQLAGGALSDPHEIDPAEYLHRLSEMHEQREHRNPLDATLRLGIELIEPDTQECWRALAIFPDTFDVDAAAAAWECDQHQAQHQLDTLLAHNLIENALRHGAGTVALDVTGGNPVATTTIGSPPSGSLTTTAQPAQTSTTTASTPAIACGMVIGNLKRRRFFAFWPSGVLSSSSAMAASPRESWSGG